MSISPFLEVGAQRYFVQDTGGDLPAVVMSHGFLMDHEMFAPQVEVLRDRYRVITWDLRHHGQTHSAEEPFSIWDAVNDLVAILDSLGVDRATMCGFSFGGWISTRFALAHPGRTSALVVLDSYERMEDPETRASYLAFKDVVVSQGFNDEIVETFRGLLFHPEFDSSVWVGKWRGRSPLSRGYVYDAMFGRDDINDRLGEITCPALVVHGEANPANPAEVSEELVRRLGNARPLVVVPGAGHTSNLEQPAAVNAALLAFLAVVDNPDA